MPPRAAEASTGTRAVRRVAAVTGALGGIGQGIAVALSWRGFDVVACDRTVDDPALEGIARQSAPEARIAAVAGDLDAHGGMVDGMLSAFGRLDRLVNNAGVSVKSRGDLLDVGPDSYDLNFGVNTRGSFFLTQAVCRRMLNGGGEHPEGARSLVFIPRSKGEPEDIDRAVATLAACDPPFTTDAAIQVDGGMHIHHH